VFAGNGINIASQYLQTHGDIGYVVIDIDAAHSDVALVKLHDVPGTIRSRVLF
jgi:D-3-phosphoglycerate dehydrogenase / 2-oxoglutarate reductase